MTWVPVRCAIDEARIDERGDGRLDDRRLATGARTWRRRRPARWHRCPAPRRSGRAGGAGRPRRPGSVGVPASTRLTLATTPGWRMLPARQRIDGPTVTGIDELDQRALGVGAGDDRPRLDGLAGGQDDAGRATVDRAHGGDLGRRSDLDAERPGGRGQRLGQGAWATAWRRASRPRRHLRCQRRRSAGPPSSRPTRDRGGRSGRRARRWPPGAHRSRRPRPRSRRRPWAGPAGASGRRACPGRDRCARA